MKRVLCGLLAIAGCKPIYDSQYDDRAAELEQSRVDFVPASDQVQFFSAATKRLYWISLVKPLDTPTLHSIDPATGAQLDYTLAITNPNNFAQDFSLSDQLIVRCSFSTATSFDATTNNPTMVQSQTGDQVSDECAVDGGAVYFHFNTTITRWIPGTPTSVVVDLTAAGVGTGSSGGFGVFGTQMLYEEGGRLWLIDLTKTSSAKWLMNKDMATGTVVFDDRGVVYGASSKTDYTLYSDDSTFDLGAAIDDGGYSLNFEHGDVQKLSDFNEFALYNHHVIYRAQSGIFAYNLETKKVIDILLDRGDSFDADPFYRKPTITTGGMLFVENNNSLSGSMDNRALYRVDLSARLK